MPSRQAVTCSRVRFVPHGSIIPSSDAMTPRPHALGWAITTASLFESANPARWKSVYSESHMTDRRSFTWTCCDARATHYTHAVVKS